MWMMEGAEGRLGVGNGNGVDSGCGDGSGGDRGCVDVVDDDRGVLVQKPKQSER